MMKDHFTMHMRTDARGWAAVGVSPAPAVGCQMRNTEAQLQVALKYPFPGVFLFCVQIYIINLISKSRYSTEQSSVLFCF
jgi:hypothetical protein